MLVYCEDGQNRSISLIIGYLMVRFKWSFYKCLEFVDNKIPNMEIKKKTFLQLKKIALEYE